MTEIGDCGSDFPASEQALKFCDRFFPTATRVEWSDWRWQARNRIRTTAEFERLFVLTDDEREAINRRRGSLPPAVTPYYASLMSETDATEPLRRTHIPVLHEFSTTPDEDDDPLGEDSDSPVPNLVHRYPDRVLLLATGFCATYCRYCVRSRMVGEAGGDYHFSTREWDPQIAYIAAHPEIRDCLISGGDPLTLSTEKLGSLIARLRSIPHLDFIRIGTKVPVVLPQRITHDLASMLRQHGVWLSVHFTHPAELTLEVTEACRRLADAGVPLASQTVLLRDINDSVPVMKALMHGLLRLRVRPYYLYQCDLVSGSAHFRTPVSKGIEIIEGLRGHTSGYAVPQFVIDAPGGGGKIPLLPDYLAGRNGGDLLLRNFAGNIHRYPANPSTVEGNPDQREPLTLLAT